MASVNSLLRTVIGLSLVGAAVWATAGHAQEFSFTTGWLPLGDGWQTPYYIKEAVEPGPVVMVFGGVHGDEPAGAAAADDIRHWGITRGTLIVVPAAAPQALAARTRTIPNEGDLNRSFPGSGDSIDATIGPTATALWAFVREQDPDWFFDLHEGYDFRSSNPDSVGSSIIHANERVTNVYVERMLDTVNEPITDPGKLFVSLLGPVNNSVARGTVLHLDARGMIVETTTKGQPLSLRVDQHRTIINRFLSDQQMLAGPFGGDRGAIIDDFSFDEPDGMLLSKVGNSFPHGGSWNTSPFDSRTLAGQLRIQRTSTGTASTTTGMLGAGEVRVRPASDPTKTTTDIPEGFATMIVGGWDFRGTAIGEKISLGFRSATSPDVFDTAQLVLERTALDEVSVFGQGFGAGGGMIAAESLFGASQEGPVQFVLQLSKRENLDGSPLVAGANVGGYYRLYYQVPGQDFIEIGAGAPVRQSRNGDFLNLQISGPVGSDGGFFDIDRILFSSAFPASLPPPWGTGPVTVDVASGRVSQGQAGYGVIGEAASVTKIGGGTLVFDAANAYTGPTTIAAGTLEVANAAAVSATPVTVTTGATLAVVPGLAFATPAITLAGGTLSAGSLAIRQAGGIASLAIDAGRVVGGPLVTIAQGGLMSLSDSGQITIPLGGLDIDQESGGLIDLGGGQITVAPGGITPSALRADIIAGRSDGSWRGTGGILSSAAADSRGTRTVGYLVAADGTATVSFAAAGDTDLDGQVNVFDLVGMMGGGRYGTGRSAVWAEGDFNYDGLTDVFDLVGIGGAAVYGAGRYLPGLTAPAGGAAAVPEPSGWVSAAAGAGIGLAGLRSFSRQSGRRLRNGSGGR